MSGTDTIFASETAALNLLSDALGWVRNPSVMTRESFSAMLDNLFVGGSSVRAAVMFWDGPPIREKIADLSSMNLGLRPWGLSYTIASIGENTATASPTA